MDFTRFLRLGFGLTALAMRLFTLEAAEPAGGASSYQPLGTWTQEGLSLMTVSGTRLRVLTPNWLELTLVTSDNALSSRGFHWDFVTEGGDCRLPSPDRFEVTAGTQRLTVKAVGFKRRVLYAPLKQRDLRVGNYLYLELAAPAPPGAPVEVKNPDRKLWPGTVRFASESDPQRWSPVLHVNQTGYFPAWPKKAMIGYYLGSAGELDPQPTRVEVKDTGSASGQQPVKPGTSPGGSPGVAFQIIDSLSGETAFRGTATPRPDQGFPFECYRQVFEADFSPLKAPGRYKLFVPGLGTSFEFSVGEGVAAAFARANALGIYHQRCGTENALPFTRFTHRACHTAPAEVPDMTSKFKSANESLSKESSNYKDNPRHVAPQLKSVSASLYPFVRRGTVDVSGGHHDAGDYSKYTINSAAFIHHLVFAADVFPGVADLDNLGLPESGDGKSDVLQEAKWEADFLAKMQDDDGGFYFLVYPRDREYENDVLPDKGDPQIVFPKTTSATAAAVAALAQCSSSPTFKRQFPEAASLYLSKAKKGWGFLERAIAKHGKDGAYQKITHYGDQFMHDDELAWAACEMFLATHEPSYQRQLLEWFNPADAATRRWGWWRLYDSYGCATRSYAFAVRSGRMKSDEMSPLLLEGCENEIAAAGEDQLRRARQSAYGTSFPEETKRVLSAGWYFSSDAGFDLAAACQVEFPANRDLRPAMREAILSNLNYEEGCNPVNVTYLTGMGWKRQREIVHHYAQNDRRVLPPTGIPLGNIQAGFGWNYVYNKELDLLSFPPDGSRDAPYPFYDRWGDGFNLSQEFVIVNQARALGYTCWLMAETPLKTQPWKPVAAQITAVSGSSGKVQLSADKIDLSVARIVWEGENEEPVYGATGLKPANPASKWREAEAELPDGRRVFGVWEANAK